MEGAPKIHIFFQPRTVPDSIDPSSGDHNYSFKTSTDTNLEQPEKYTDPKCVKIIKTTKNYQLWNYYRCKYCPHRTKCFGVMKTHMKRHRVTKVSKKFDCINARLERYWCHFCSFKTTLYINFNIHLKKCHKGVETGTVLDINGTLKYTNIQKGYSCEGCLFKTSSQFLYIIHIRHCRVWKSLKKTEKIIKIKDTPTKNKNKSRKSINCPYCRYKSCYRKTITRHLQTHCKQDKNNWYCRECEFRTQSRKDIDDHLENHRIKRNGFRLEDIISLTEEQNSPPRLDIYTIEAPIHTNKPIEAPPLSPQLYRCEKCLFTSNSIIGYNNHLIFRHGDDTDIKWLRCVHCKYKTVFYHCLARHLFSHRKGACKLNSTKDQKLEKHSDDEPTQNKITWYYCEHCYFKTMICNSLKQHILVSHIKTETLTCYKCHLCSFKTSEDNEMRRHVREKHVDPQFNDWIQCQICPDKFKTDGELRGHVMVKHIL